MAAHVLKRIRHRWHSALAVIAFSGILVGILCGLYASLEDEKANYEVFRQTVPVTVTVTNIEGTRSDDLVAEPWVYNVFTSDYELGAYLKDYQLKMCEYIDTATINEEEVSLDRLIGITGVKADSTLSQNPYDAISWFDGYDESVLRSDEAVCILPEKLMPEGNNTPVKISLSFLAEWYQYGQVVERFTHSCTLTVVGTHNAGSRRAYCPFSVMKTVYSRLNNVKVLESISATMVDNDKIGEMWEEAKDWFVEPDISGKETPWDYAWYDHYPYALVVDDSQLVAASEVMENSIRTNQLSTLVIFILSAAASFLIGFLMIRSRKREILLMRTMGTSNSSIYGSFALEQMLCVILGTLFGGAGFLWQPVERLGLFVGIYFVGLSLALLIFLHTNLLTTMKQDE